MASQTNGFHSNSRMDEEFEEISIEVPWGHIAGKWWGPKEVQPILAIHGWQDNAGSFDPLSPLLINEDTSILCIDLPGHGLSSHYPAGHYYSIWDGVFAVRRIVKHFKWNNIKILGHSLGAGIAFVYSAIFPDEVESYVTIDMISPVPRDTEVIADRLQSTIDKFIRYDSFNCKDSTNYEFDEMVQIFITAYHDSITSQSAKILLKRGAKQSKANPKHFSFSRDARLKSDGLLANITFDQVLTFSSRIKCDVLNIKADSGLKLHKPLQYDAIVEKIRQNARRFENCSVPGTHHVHINNPENVYSIIKSFWHMSK